MSNIVFNIAKGRVVELYHRVENGDPANCAIILIPIETTGLEADSVLVDADSVADVLAGTTNEQSTVGRKALVAADLAAPAPDDTNDRYSLSLPTTTWAAASGNAISKILVAYDSDTTGGTDSSLIPLTLFDFVITPDGSDVDATGAEFYRAS